MQPKTLLQSTFVYVKTRALLNAIILGILVASTISTAHAKPVKWYLKAVLLSDGATLTGYFIYDADERRVGSIEISSPEGAKNIANKTTIDSFYYTNGNTQVSGPTPRQVFFVKNEKDRSLTLSFESELTNDGGEVRIMQLDHGRMACSCELQSYPTSDKRVVVIGFVTTVPPEQWPR